jgi:hypothetical protein
VRQKNVGVINGMVSPSLRRQMLYPQQSMTTVVLGRIHALMMAEQSATGAKQVSPIHAQHEQRTMQLRTTCLNYTFAC